MNSKHMLELTSVRASYTTGTFNSGKITIDPNCIEIYYSWGLPLDEKDREQPDKIGNASTIIRMKSGFEFTVAESEQHIRTLLESIGITFF